MRPSMATQPIISTWVACACQARSMFRACLQIFNILCEQPETVAAFLVPRARTVAARGQAGRYIKFLTLPRAMLRFLTAPLHSGRFFDGEGAAARMDAWMHTWSACVQASQEAVRKSMSTQLIGRLCVTEASASVLMSFCHAWLGWHVIASKGCQSDGLTVQGTLCIRRSMNASWGKRRGAPGAWQRAQHAAPRSGPLCGPISESLDPSTRLPCFAYHVCLMCSFSIDASCKQYAQAVNKATPTAAIKLQASMQELAMAYSLSLAGAYLIMATDKVPQLPL